MGSIHSLSSSEEAETNTSKSDPSKRKLRIKRELAETTAALNNLIYSGQQAASDILSNRDQSARNGFPSFGSGSSCHLVEDAADSPRRHSESTSDNLYQNTTQDADKENVSKPERTSNTNESHNVDDEESLEDFLSKLVKQFDSVPSRTTEGSGQNSTSQESKHYTSVKQDSGSDSLAVDSEQHTRENRKDSPNKSPSEHSHGEKDEDVETREIDSEEERELLEGDEGTEGDSNKSYNSKDTNKSDASSSDTYTYDLDDVTKDNEKPAIEEQVNKEPKVPSNNDDSDSTFEHKKTTNELLEEKDDVSNDSAKEKDKTRENAIDAKSDVEMERAAESDRKISSDEYSTSTESESESGTEETSSSDSEDEDSEIAHEAIEVDEKGRERTPDKSESESGTEETSSSDSEDEDSEIAHEAIEVDEKGRERTPDKSESESGTEETSSSDSEDEDSEIAHEAIEVDEKGRERTPDKSDAASDAERENVSDLEQEDRESSPERKRRKTNPSESSSSSSSSRLTSSSDEDEESLSSDDTGSGESDPEDGSDSDEPGAALKNVSMVRRPHSKKTPNTSVEPETFNREGEAKEVKPRKKSKKPNRRKKILKDDDLKLSTIRAIEDEKRKTKRMDERRKKFKIIDVDETSKKKIVKLVLDYDSSGAPIVSVDTGLLGILKPHQANGVMFMWEVCFESVERIKANDAGHGCILAHCMGLGKTLQVVTFVHTLFSHPSTRVRRVLVVCPKSTALNWCNEFDKWLARATQQCKFKVYELSGTTMVSTRLAMLSAWTKEGGVFVLGYQMFRNLVKLTKMSQELEKKTGKKTKKDKTNKKAEEDGETSEYKKLSDEDNKIIEEALLVPGPDLVVCDEGHLLKNEETQVSKAFSLVQCRRRVVLTGTPLQNNLNEYYCMVNFVKNNLLGSDEEFNNRFVYPIINGQFNDSNEDEIQEMKRRSHVLHKLLERTIQRKNGSLLSEFLPPKFEYVLFITLTKLQTKLYRYFLREYAMPSKSKNVRGLARFCMLRDFQTVLRIYTHPLTLKDHKNKEKKRITKEKKKMEKLNIKKRIERSDIPLSWYKEVVKRIPDDLRLSNKLVVLFDILRRCSAKKEKLLVFSQSLYALDVIEHFLERADRNKGNRIAELDDYSDYWTLNVDYFRLDGSSKATDRAKWCDQFNDKDNPKARLFLISTLAGGLGINLVAANRVVLLDVCWNPSHDVQSIFRVYRIGQERPCFVYRFIAMGTIEQKMYNRQVIKLSVAKRVVDEEQVERHYTEDDLADLYRLDEPPAVRALPPVPKDDLMLRGVIADNECIHEYHVHDSLLADLQEEHLSELERVRAWEEFERERAAVQAAEAAGPAPSGNLSTLDRMYALITGAETESSVINRINMGASTSGITSPRKENAKEKSPLQMSKEQKKAKREEESRQKSLQKQERAKRLAESLKMKQDLKVKRILLKMQHIQLKKQIGDAVYKILPRLPKTKHKNFVTRILAAGPEVQQPLLNLVALESSPHVLNDESRLMDVLSDIVKSRHHESLGFDLISSLPLYSYHPCERVAF